MTTKTAREILNTARTRETVVRLCLRGDLVAEFEAAEARLADLTMGAGWGNGDDETQALAERLTELRAEMLEDTVEFRFKALRRKAWDDLETQHASPEGGTNMNTFAPALILASLVDPVMTEAELDELYDLINDGQRGALFAAAWNVNTEATEVPFSDRASAVMRARAQK
jgi:hypothetical protein